MSVILKRLAEPSTWAGLAALGAVFSPKLAQFIPEIGEALALLAVTISGIIAVVREEKGGNNSDLS